MPGVVVTLAFFPVRNGMCFKWTLFVLVNERVFLSTRGNKVSNTDYSKKWIQKGLHRIGIPRKKYGIVMKCQFLNRKKSNGIHRVVPRPSSTASCAVEL